MNMDKKLIDNQYIVDGIFFSSRKEYERALKDKENIEYISAKMDLTNPRTVMKLYNSLIKKNTLTTAVGFVFLKQLYDVIALSADVDLNQVYALEKDRYINANGSSSDYLSTVRATASQSLTASKDYNRLSNTNKILKFTVLILIGCVVAMFIFTMKADTLTYNNAKESVINEYEQWNSELTQREKELDEREETLNSQR